MFDTIILAFNHFDLGGLQTLMVRIAEKARCNNIQSIILYKNADKKMLDMCINKKIDARQLFEKRKITELFNTSLNANKEILLITFEIDDFMLFEKAKNSVRHGNRIKHIVYNVSVGSAIFTRRIGKNKLSCIYNTYRDMVGRFFLNNQFIFMDEDTLDSFNSYYDFSVERKWDSIFLLPMNISDKPDVFNTANYESDSILTVARAEFPYKGYLLGLVNEFDIILKKHKNIMLTIVSFGSDFLVLKEKIEELNKDVKNHILLINGLSEKEIRAELKKAKLYIGMGTTILDAADEAIPCIVTTHSTNENACVGLFCEIPYIIGSRVNKQNINVLIDYLLSLNFEDYCNQRNKTYEEYRKHYDINTFFSRLLERASSIEGLRLTTKEIILHDAMCMLRSLKRMVSNASKITKI